MMAAFQIALFVVLVGTAIANVDMAPFCREQEDVYQNEARAVRRKLVSMGRSSSAEEMQNLCKAMVKFSNTAFDTHTTCPESGDSVGYQQWQGINGLINNVCPDDSLLLECSNDVVQRLMNHCAQTTNDIQIGSGNQVVCQKSLEYLTCVESAAALCSGSRALLQSNVYAIVASTRSTMAGPCGFEGRDEGMQGDAPAGGSGPVGPATPNSCTVDIVNLEMSACVHSYRFASRAHNADICRVQHQYLSCVDRVRANCPAIPVAESMESVRNRFQVECRNSYVTCVPEVLNGSTEVTNFCLNKIGNLEVNSAAYCSKMRDLNRCLSSLRDVCPVAHDSERVSADRVSAGVDLGLSTYCGGQ